MLYCRSCILKIFKLSKGRLRRLCALASERASQAKAMPEDDKVILTQKQQTETSRTHMAAGETETEVAPTL